MLAALRTHLIGAKGYIEAQIATSAGDRDMEERWRLIGKRIMLVRAAATKDAGR